MRRRFASKSRKSANTTRFSDVSPPPQGGGLGRGRGSAPGSFTNVGFLAGVGFEFDSRCVVSEDLDLDGRPDLILTEQKLGEPGRLHVVKNVWPTKNHWIGVRLHDTPGRSVEGARITISSCGRSQTALIVSGDSYRSQHSPSRVFGIGKTRIIEFVEVRWADGTVQRIEKPPLDRYLDVFP